MNPPIENGLVISHFGSSVAVEAVDGQVFHCLLRRNQLLPVVGDRVKWQKKQSNQGVVISIENRHNLLAKGDGRGKTRPIAANIDVLAVVTAPPPIFSEYWLDRYLVASTLLQVPTIIVLNKIDLLDGPQRERVWARLAPYQRMVCPVLLTTTYQDGGTDALGAFLQNKTTVLVGPSGVGKSSLIAKLAHCQVVPIGEVTDKGTGKHMTTAVRLYHLPKGGHLIDSPGVRDFNLWRISQPEILKGFPDFQGHLTGCRFRDCQHWTEPGCALEAAATKAQINASRLASYRKLLEEMQTGHG